MNLEDILCDIDSNRRQQLMYDTLVRISQTKPYAKPTVHIAHFPVKTDFTFRHFLQPNFDFNILVKSDHVLMSFFNIDNNHSLEILLQVISDIGFKVVSICDGGFKFLFSSGEYVYDTLIKIFGSIVAPGLVPMSLAASKSWAEIIDYNPYALHRYVESVYEEILDFNRFGYLNIRQSDVYISSQVDSTRYGYNPNNNTDYNLIGVNKIELNRSEKLNISFRYENLEFGKHILKKLFLSTKYKYIYPTAIEAKSTECVDINQEVHDLVDYFL